MEYIIDAYNLIRSSVLKKYEGDQKNRGVDILLYMLSEYRRKHPSTIFTIVIDGFLDIQSPDKKIKILFSHKLTADEIIREILEHNIQKNIARTIVSNDREVQACGIILGSKVLNVDGFMQLICPPTPKTTPKHQDKSSLDVNKIQIEDELKKFYESRGEK
jgi:hypothetical protein